MFELTAVGDRSDTGASWHIEVSFLIRPEYTVEAEPVQINESRSSLDAAQATRRFRTKVVVILLRRGHRHDGTMHAFWMQSHDPVCVDQFSIQVREDRALRLQSKEQTRRTAERLDVSIELARNIFGQFGNQLALATRPSHQRRDARSNLPFSLSLLFHSRRDGVSL